MNHWPTYIEVNLANIRHNVRQIRARIGPDVTLMLVIKADAYGHGASVVAKAALEAGAERFGIACVDEGIQLRQAGISCPLLIVGLALPDTIPDIVKYDITPTVCDRKWAQALSEEAVRQNKTVRVHVNVNTGMNRYGIDPQSAVDFISEIQRYPHLDIEGIYTHFATAYSTAEPVHQQFSLFQEVLAQLDAHNIYVPLRHCASTGAILNHPETFLNMVRPGLLTTTPYPATKKGNCLDLRECFELKSKVMFVRSLKTGDPVGYEQLYRCAQDETLAVVSAGWADGVPRELTNKGYVLIHGERCPIRGRVMCDQLFADVSNLDGVEPGDEVVIIGTQGNACISGWEWRDILGGVSSPVSLRSHRNSRVEIRYIDCE